MTKDGGFNESINVVPEKSGEFNHCWITFISDPEGVLVRVLSQSELACNRFALQVPSYVNLTG